MLPKLRNVLRRPPANGNVILSRKPKPFCVVPRHVDTYPKGCGWFLGQLNLPLDLFETNVFPLDLQKVSSLAVAVADVGVLILAHLYSSHLPYACKQTSN